MKIAKWLVVTALAATLPTGSPGVVSAEFTITPSINVREEYNDNIFLTRSHREDDFITTINPALKLGYKSRLLDVSLDYGLNFRFYADHTDKNETSLSQAQRAKLETTFSPYRDIIFIKVMDEYSRVPIDERRQVALDNSFVNMTDSNRFVINPYIDYPVTGTLRLNAGYRFENLWYKEKEGDDANNHQFNLGLAKEFTRDLSASVSYGYHMHSAELSEDYDRQSANASVSYRPGKLSLSGSMGRTWFDYDESKDLNSNTWDLRASYPVADMFTLSVGHSQGFNDSVNLGTYKTETTSASITFTGKVPLTLTYHESVSKYNEINRKDESSGITVNSSIPVPITPKLTGNVMFNYATTEHHTPGESVATEEIDRYRMGVSLAYEMRVTTVSVGYTHNWNDSSVDVNDYRSNIVWVQARVAF